MTTSITEETGTTPAAKAKPNKKARVGARRAHREMPRCPQMSSDVRTRR
jgi:hypothetical protein